MKRVILASVGVLAMFATVGVAGAADLPRREAMPAKAVPYVAPYTWTGFYVGINGGGGWGRSAFSAPFATPGFDLSGPIVGGTLGYNWQAGQAVFGLEGDLDWSDIRGSRACAGTTCTTRNQWLSTVRGRLGYAANQFMPYITGGLAVGDIKSTIAGVGSSDDTKAGWTLGGGLEAKIAGPWSAKIEYLYVDLGRGSNVAGGGGSNSSFHTNLVRGGINYKF
ncbi:MAG TPA: outer membrane protein [Pseudolabrys sp.]|jgi:outer membrane immunogenic protein|nr:outer membrane protein [Pseudolabrys sp.]